MRPYKYLHSFFILRVGHFKIFQHFLFTFPQRVSEDVNSIHIQFHVKITIATEIWLPLKNMTCELHTYNQKCRFLKK
jgi:hypothetical protein